MDLSDIIKRAIDDQVDEADVSEGGKNIEEILRGCLTNYRTDFSKYQKPSYLVSLRRRKPAEFLTEDLNQFYQKIRKAKQQNYESVFELEAPSHEECIITSKH
jgi:hypothetical protein